MVNPTGYTALDLVGFSDKGAYSSAATYVKNDLAHYAGNVWKCLLDDTTAITPAEGLNWTIFIAEPSNAVESSIAPIETSPAEADHAVNTQLYYNDTLYKVIAAIDIGDTLTVGTNIQLADNITTQLSQKANTSSLANVATSGSYSDLSNKPTLGTAAAKDTTNVIAQNSTDPVESGAVYTSETALGSRIDAVDEEIAPIESGTVASQVYAIGDHFIKDDVLYKAKTAIAQGETLTLNTNYEVADNVTDQLTSLKEALSKVSTSIGTVESIGGTAKLDYSINEFVLCDDGHIYTAISGITHNLSTITKGTTISNNPVDGIIQQFNSLREWKEESISGVITNESSSYITVEGDVARVVHNGAYGKLYLRIWSETEIEAGRLLYITVKDYPPLFDGYTYMAISGDVAIQVHVIKTNNGKDGRIRIAPWGRSLARGYLIITMYEYKV